MTNSDNKADCTECCVWEGDDRSWNGRRPILEANDEEIEAGRDNEGWYAGQSLFEVGNGDVAAQHLDDLRIPNILKTELESQMPEDSGMVVKRLSIVWLC